MAQPTVTCNLVSGSTPTLTNNISNIDYGSVLIPTSGTVYLPVKCRNYTFAGGDGYNLSFYISTNDSSTATKQFAISSSYTDPSTLVTTNGTVLNTPSGGTWTTIPTTQPSSPNVVSTLTAGSNTNYIYTVFGCPNTASSGNFTTMVTSLYYEYV